MAEEKNELGFDGGTDTRRSCATTDGVQMIPIDQVSALIQKLTADQEARLKQQRGEIVREVLQSIRDSGTGLAEAQSGRGNDLSTLRLAASVAELPPDCRKQRGVGAAVPSNRLDQHLHALVLHSLSESGLDFPHVQNSRPNQQFSYEKRQNTSGTDSRSVKSSLKNDKHPSGPVMLCRAEGTDTEGDFLSLERRSASPQEDRCGSEQVKPMKRKQIQERASAVRDHPLRKSLRRRSRRTDNAELDDDAVDRSFRAARSKIDHRTLAILDKTKALLDRTPERETRVSVAELRDRYRAASQDDEGAADKKETTSPRTCEPPDQETSVSDAGVTSSTRHADDDNSGQEGAAVDRSSRAAQLSSISQRDEKSTDKDQARHVREGSEEPSSLRCNIALLRAPEHPPDDDNEWENELARQILTIYATSVKAKATAADTASVRPPSGDARGIIRSPIPSSRGSRRPEKSPSSLPALTHQQRIQTRGDGPRHLKATSRQTESVNYSWEPSRRLDDGKVVVNMPSIPKPIWFAGTGAVKAVWCALTEGFGELTATPAAKESSAAASRPSTLCNHRLCEEVRRMEAQRKFLECVTAVEALLIALVRARGASELEMKLWKQLVVTCNAFASRCIDYKKFSAALQLMKQAEHLVDNSVLVGDAMRLELLAYLYDTYAHYYYRRRKPHAALQYCSKALEIHSRQSSWSHAAKSRLHVATVLSLQKRHAQALAHMGGVLALVEADKLGEGASGQKLCLVAVCYNNLAVEQLHLRELEAAGVAADNAHRLAKLCLSYSNRWLAQLDATRQCAALALATLLQPALQLDT